MYFIDMFRCTGLHRLCVAVGIILGQYLKKDIKQTLVFYLFKKPEPRTLDDWESLFDTTVDNLVYFIKSKTCLIFLFCV